MRISRCIAVMLGGPSAERDVSLRSGAAVARALRARGHRVSEVDPAGGGWSLSPGTEVVFLALHGTYGEDGVVQAELDALAMPYTGCDAAASRLAFDKAESKRRFEQAGVRTPRSLVVRSAALPFPADWSPPLVVKPVRQGSSVGLTFLEQPAEWPAALALGLRHDTEVLVEERILGRELTVGVLGEATLPVLEIRPRRGGYDYRNKYTAGATDYFCPAQLSPETTRKVQTAAWRAFQALGGRDYGRVDVMLDAEDRPWVLEVNTLPGMTETSLFPKAAAVAGLDFGALCERMVDLALTRRTAACARPQTCGGGF